MRGAVALVLLVGCGFSVSGGASDGSVVGDDTGHDARADWWDAHWLQRFPITIDTSKLAGPVTAFPVLVRLTNIRDGGKDLRFVSANNATVYPYEIDTIDSVGATTAWVQLTLSPTAPTTLWAYTNNAAASDASDAAMVFGSFESVSHLGALADSSGHGHTASSTSMTTPTETSGMIGDARHFDGSDDYLELDASVGLGFSQEMTVSAWFDVDAFDLTYQCIVCKGNGTWRLSRADEEDAVAFDTTSHGTGETTHGSVQVDDQNWHLISAVMTPTNKLLYVDGKLDLSNTYTAPIDTNDQAVRIGMNTQANVGPPGRWWHGAIDEVRLRSIAVDAAWISAEYTTVADPAFVTVGAAESY